MANPPQSAATILSIEIGHEGCLGRCPIYRVALTSSGVARYEGRCFTPLLGLYEAPLDSAVFSHLARLVLKSDYFRSDTPLNVTTDVRYVTITVGLTDGRSRTVWYGPGRDELARRIEAVTGALPWGSVAPPPSRACAT
jgi:hypothetical protein